LDKGELLARGFGGGGGRREARDKAASPAPCCDLPSEAPVKCANRELSEDYVWRSGLAERHVQDFCSRFSSDDCPSASLVGVIPGRRAESDDGFNANISLITRGKRQSVVLKADSQFRGASITLSR
jgi:hypothetical protein